MKYFLLLFLLLIHGFLYGQSLTESQATFLSIHGKIIDHDNNFNDSNWDIISNEFQDKEIILLGEFNHGSKEVFQIRNSLIKYLHQQYDFEVILFESGIGELIVPNFEKQQLTPKQMTYGFFGGWRTGEFVDLMEYVQKKNLQIAGFDVQRTGRSFERVLNNTTSSIISDSTLYSDLENRYTVVSNELRQDKPYNALKFKTENLIDDYRTIYDAISKSPTSSHRLLLMQKTLLNRIAYLQYYLNFKKDNNWSRRWAARDSAMADNIHWLARNIYPGKKLIVVGHNFHVSKFNEKETVMGEILYEDYGDKMYTIGTFARAGSYANNSGKEKFMSPADSTLLDLKDVIDVLDGYATYLPVNKYDETGSKWLNNKIIVNDTFIDLYNSNKMVLSKHFDGLLFLDHISPPEK